MPKMRLFLIPTVFLAISLKAYAQDKHSDENRPYEFGFNIEGEQHRHEKKDENGIIMGEFGFITADGVYHVTVYATDENGNFKILSMKNIRLMPFPTTGAKSATPSTTTTTTTTARPYRGQLPASVNTAAPPDLDPRSLFKPNPQASCSSCSLPPKPVEQPARPSSNGFNGKAGVGRPLTNYKDTVEKQSPNSGLKASPRSDDDENSIFDERYNEAPINILSSNSPNQPNSKFRPGDADGSNSLFPPNNDPSNFSLNPPKDPVLQNRNFVPQDKKNTPKDRIFTPQERNIVPQAKNIPSQNRNFVPQDKNITPKDRMFTPQERNFAPQDQNVPPQDKNLNRNKAKLNHNADFKMDSVDPNNSNDLEKPLLLSGQMKPFEENAAYSGKEGLPDGLTAEDMMDLLYRFNYTVGFHGHHEDGYRNGDKSGDYFVNYRDGVQSKVEYKANEFGYQPNITRVQLGLDSPDTPKEETEKNEEFGLKGYEFKWFYVPKYHNLS